jgi:thiamine-monophosphate kinase
LTGELERDDYLTGRYQKPQPRLALGQQLIGIASATIDISDGLALDLENLCRASKVGAKVYLGKVPLSGPAKEYAAGDQQKLIELITAGDDFELLFTLPAEKEHQVPEMAKTADLPITVIGEITEAGECEFLDPEGRAIAFRKKGYRHFSERG